MLAEQTNRTLRLQRCWILHYRASCQNITHITMKSGEHSRVARLSFSHWELCNSNLEITAGGIFIDFSTLAQLLPAQQTVLQSSLGSLSVSGSKSKAGRERRVGESRHLFQSIAPRLCHRRPRLCWCHPAFPRQRCRTSSETLSSLSRERAENHARVVHAQLSPCRHARKRALS